MNSIAERQSPSRLHSSVLLVEDQQESQILTTIFLKETCEVSCASNAQEALAVLQEKTFDVILIDVALVNGISGIELTKMLRQKEKFEHTPIIAVTACGIQEHKQRFLEAGMNDYLAKPYTREQLVDIVRRWLSQN